MMSKMLIFFLFLAPGVVLASPAGPGSPLTATQILAEAKTASGGNNWNAIQSMRVEATMTLFGHSIARTTLIDMQTGNMVTRAKLDGMTIVVVGFDNGMAWHAKHGQKAARDKRKSSVTGAYQGTYGWWYPKRSPAKVKLIGSHAKNGNAYWVIRIVPKGGSAFDVWINEKTHLIAREVTTTPKAKSSYTVLSDYRTIHGVKMPFDRQAESTVHGQKVKTVVRLENVVVNVPVKATDFSMPHQT